MIGKIAYAFARREASNYRAQGLSEEAREIYHKMKASSPHLPPELRADIDNQLRQLEHEMNPDCVNECQALSDEQIAVIKQGWAGNATIEEMRGCALEFFRLGHFRHAIEELKMLSRVPGAGQRLAGAFAACLIRLHRPAALPMAAGKIARELFRDYQTIILFQIAIAEKAVEFKRPDHALSMLRHVHCRYRGLPPEISERLLALARRLGSGIQPPVPAPDSSRPVEPPALAPRPGRFRQE
jgi:hypothetical protein